MKPNIAGYKTTEFLEDVISAEPNKKVNKIIYIK